MLEGVIHTRNGHEIPVTYGSDFCMAPAQTKPVTRDQLRRQLIKTGGSPFSIRNFTLSYNGDMFAPLASLNHARREFLVLAEETLAAAYRPSPSDVNQAYRLWEDLKPGVHLQTSGTG